MPSAVLAHSRLRAFAPVLAGALACAVRRSGAFSGFEAVADAADGEDLRAAGGLDLAPEPGDVRLEPEEVRVGLGGPAGANEAEMRNKIAVGADERLGEAVLDGCEVQLLLADARLVAAKVEEERAGVEGRAAGRVAVG